MLLFCLLESLDVDMPNKKCRDNSAGFVDVVFLIKWILFFLLFWIFDMLILFNISDSLFLIKGWESALE